MTFPSKFQQVNITGVGYHLPDNIVTNKDLEEMMDTSDEWIFQRTGIRERRFAENGVAPSDLAKIAVEDAIAMAGISTDEIDLLIVASLSPEHYFPGTCAFLQHKLNMGTTPSMDLRCQCSGFIYAIEVGRSMVAAGNYKNVVVCGVEIHSRALDLSTRGRDTAVLFGDGAGAVVLQSEPNPEHGILTTKLHSEGNYANKLWVEAPRLAKAPIIDNQMLEEGKICPQMDGRFVFKHAVKRLPQVVTEALNELHILPKDIDLFLFHQANLRINERVADNLNIPPEKLYNNIERYGNCSAASIPICLAECVEQGRLKRGDLICLAAFGSGFTWGASIIRW